MKASEFYHHPKYLFNCAQAIVYKWSEVEVISSLKVADFKRSGSGRAPDGACGALYGALALFEGNTEQQKRLKSEFEAAIGSPLCRTIRKEKMATCRHCIDVADEWVEQLASIVI
ncbi:MAG: C-GCAxxG-C-C family protein [Marinilabiliaceae bacterium]|nr:C-GCAxxG-C-C family protein [Marinilabiliaceae bacterium]